VSRFAKLRAEMRQRRHHRAFRIAPPEDGLLREQLERLLAEVREPVQEPKPELDEKLLADAATNLWRAQRRLARDGQLSAKDRQTGRYLVTCRDALTDAGMVIQDHDGDAFHPGRSIEVLVFQEDPAMAGEVVLETVRPTIYLHDRRIQMGQVIVGGPPSQSRREPRDQVRNDHA
jgi:hypothetical protein